MSSAVDFVKETCSELNDSNEDATFNFIDWVNKHFDKESSAYKLMLNLEVEFGSEMASRCGEMAIYTPQAIWLLGVIEGIEKDVLKERDTCKDSIKALYGNMEIKDVLDDDDDILAIVGKINGHWKYIGITKETLEKVFHVMNSQLC